MHGVRIHTGTVLAADIGSKDRIPYALVGNTVNLASRISNLTKDFACDILVSQMTHALLTGAFSMEPIAAVRGKEREVMIHRLLHQG
jgi:adenylate cyclase